MFDNIADEDMKLSPQGKIDQQCWLDIPKHFKNVELDEYVIMPNHIHGILVLCESTVGVEYHPVGVDQKVYALGRHEPFRDAESLKTIYFRCHGTDHDTHVGLFGQPLRESQKTFQHIVPNSIPSIIRSFKSAVTRECKMTAFGFRWQRNYLPREIVRE